MAEVWLNQWRLGSLDLGLHLSPRHTRKAIFLDEISRVVRRAKFLLLIAPYPRPAKADPLPIELPTMLRIHYLPQWFGLSNLAMGDALFETALYREFAGRSSLERIPDRVSILRFRLKLEENQLTKNPSELITWVLNWRTGEVTKALKPKSSNDFKNLVFACAPKYAPKCFPLGVFELFTLGLRFQD